MSVKLAPHCCQNQNLFGVLSSLSKVLEFPRSNINSSVVLKCKKPIWKNGTPTSRSAPFLEKQTFSVSSEEFSKSFRVHDGLNEEF